MKKKINYGTLLILFFIISCCVDFFGLFQEEGINVLDMLNYLFNNVPTREEVMILITAIIIAFVANAVKFFFLFGIYFIIKLANKKLKKEKLSEVDFKKYDGYFRDVLKGYNPIELSYIDDFDIDESKDYVAMLLNLKSRGVIDFDELSEKIIIKNRNISLTRLEEYFLNNIVDGKLKRFSVISINSIVQNDALEKGILQKNTENIHWKKLFISFFALVMIAIFIFNMLFKINLETVNAYLLICIIIVFFIILFCFTTLAFFGPIYLVVYLVKSARHPYIRSSLGEKINKRLEGLKNFLKDFSYLDKKEKEDLILWEDYLIYSVLFNQNSKIVNDIVDKFIEK